VVRCSEQRVCARGWPSQVRLLLSAGGEVLKEVKGGTKEECVKTWASSVGEEKV